MPVAPFKLLPHERTLNRVCVAVVGATVAAGVIAALAQPRERARCREHRTHVVELQPAALTIVPPAPAPAARCETPVAGTWEAHEYRRDRRDWVQHTLHIVEVDGAYAVEHIARVRDGDERGPVKLRCVNDADQYETIGRAALDGDQLHVWGTELLASRARCDGELGDYSLDSFTGTLDGETFDSVNNDGETAKNRPYFFRRIACE